MTTIARSARWMVLLSALAGGAASGVSARQDDAATTRTAVLQGAIERGIGGVEADAPANPQLEVFVDGPAGEALGGDTVFPGTRSPAEDPSRKLARQYYVKGALFAEKGNPAKAFELFREAVSRDPQNTWLLLRAIDGAFAVNNLPWAEEMAKSILRMNPKSEDAMVRLARAAMYRDEFTKAEEWFKKVLDVQANNVEALSGLAQISMDVRRDLNAAKEYSGRILKIQGRNFQAMLWNAEASALTGEVGPAADLFDRLLRYHPNLIMRLEGIGDRLEKLYREDDALELYRRGVVMMPSRDSVRMRWESILRKNGGEEAVLAGYEKLVEDNFRDFNIQELFADYLKRQGNMVRLASMRRAMLAVDPACIPALLDLGGLALESGDKPEAEKHFAQALLIGASDSSVYRRIGGVYGAHGDKERARELFEQAVLINPKDAEAMVALAPMAEETGDLKRAEKLLRDAIDAQKGNAYFLRELAFFFFRQDRWRESRDVFEQSIAADPGDIPAKMTLASIYFRMRDGAALDRLERTLAQRSAENDEFIFRYGILALDNGEAERARRAIERIVDQAPGFVGARLPLARAYAMLDRHDLAEKSFEAATKFLPNDDARFDLANARHEYLAEIGDRPRAIVALREALAIEPKAHELRRQLAMLLARERNESEGQREIDALLAAPDYLTNEEDRELLRIEFLQALGREKEALPRAEKLLAENPESPALLLNAGALADAAGDLPAADRHYRALIAQLEAQGPAGRSLLATAYNNLAYTFAQRGQRLDEALALAEKAVALRPNAAFIIDTLGTVHLKAGSVEEALRHFEDAVKRSVGDAEIFMHAGEAYSLLGRFDDARKMFERAMAIDPTLEGLKEKHADAVKSAGKN